MNLMKNDIIWLDILSMDIRHKKKLHLTTEEIYLTQEDVELLNAKKYVNLDALKDMVHKAGFKSSDASRELGISKAFFSMALSDSKTVRGMRMRTVVALLNAIRKRKVSDSFECIFTDESEDVTKDTESEE